MEESVEDWYLDSYSQINITGNDKTLFFRMMHSLLESRLPKSDGMEILEVGGNVGEHIRFVKGNWRKYLITDIRSISAASEKSILDQAAVFEIADVQKLPYPSSSFDRVISTCLFHHISNPTEGFKEILRVLRPGGFATILIPNDPGIMYRLIRSLTTVRLAKKMRKEAICNLVHAIEHRNHYLSLRVIALNIFKDSKVSLRGFPFIFDLYNMNAITVLKVQKVSKIQEVI